MISMKRRLSLLVCLLVISSSYANSRLDIVESTVTNYLKKPTGQYGVGFQDFHWVNQAACPDVNFNGKNQADFSPANIKHCHEIVARIYYPVTKKGQHSAYYEPFVKQQQQVLKQDSNISAEQLAQLSQINSYSAQDVNIVSNQLFPVLIFAPGLGWSAQVYENLITELTSQGYIVIGVNSPFINLVALPDGHVVDLPPMKSPDEIDKNIVPLQKQDLSYIYALIHDSHHLNSIFSSMDLSHIGIFGHSIGGRNIADIIHAHPDWFQAGVSLDIGFDKSNESRKKFNIPFMHEICSNRTLASNDIPVTFELGKNGYLVGISPNENDYSYSFHGNFADYSTLQYSPAFLEFTSYLKKQMMDVKFDIKIMSHVLTDLEINKFSNQTYVLVYTDGQWYGSIYLNKNKLTDFDVNKMHNLRAALDVLPCNSVDKPSDSQMASIKTEITQLHGILSNPIGVGNGFEISTAINAYTVNFFDMYLKGRTNPAFNNCTPLVTNTYIKCGPGIY